VCVLLNGSLDTANDLRLRVKPDFKICQWCMADGRKGSLPVNRESGKGNIVSLLSLQAWNVALLIFSER
jgi:hypothetical protein